MLIVRPQPAFGWGRVEQSSPCSQVLPLPPWRPLHRRRRQPSHSVVPKTVKFGGCPPPQMMWGGVTQAQGAPDHRVLPIGGHGGPQKSGVQSSWQSLLPGAPACSRRAAIGPNNAATTAQCSGAKPEDSMASERTLRNTLMAFVMRPSAPPVRRLAVSSAAGPSHSPTAYSVLMCMQSRVILSIALGML